MNRQARVVLILLSIVATIAAAQSSTEPPLPEVTTLVQRAIQQQRVAESKEQDYVFREETGDIRLRKECTWAPKCPAPFGVPGARGVAFLVINATERNFEIFWLDGVRVARVLPPCNSCGRGAGPADSFIMNIPISDSELAAENQRVDREVAEARALRAQGKNPSSPDDPPQILFSRMLELCTFSNPRRQVVNGRSTILIDFAWNSSATPINANEALLKPFTGTIGIDEEDHTVEHVEGKFLADVKLDGGNINIRKGTRVKINNRRVDTGTWLLSRLDAMGEGHYFSFAIDGAGHIFTGNYRKFRVTTRILPVFADVTASLPASSSPKSSEPSVATIAAAQSSTADRTSAQTQARGYWVDPSTGLMWPLKDNGKDVTWHEAVSYCRDLRLAGLSDWRLPTLDELASLVDKSTPTSELVGNMIVLHINLGRHVKGSLSLTGDPWSSNRDKDRFGHPYGDGDFFDFINGKASGDLPYFRNTKYALCVRRHGD